MTLKQYLFETGADGDDATNAVTGGTRVKSTPALMKLSAAAATQGALGLRMTTDPASRTSITFTPQASSLTMACTFDFTVPSALPTGANVPTIWWLTSGSIVLRLKVDSTGAITLTRLTGATITLATGQTAGTRLRFQMWGTAATSTTGELHAKLTTIAGTLVGTAHDSTNSDIGTAAFVSCDIGVSGTSTDPAYQIDYDALQLDDGRTSLIPAVPALAVSGAVTPNPRPVGSALTLTLTPTGSNGNPILYCCTWDGVNLPATAVDGTIVVGGVTRNAQSSPVFTHTDTTSGTKTITANASQAG